MSMWSRVMGGGRASFTSWALVAAQGVLFAAIALAPSRWGPPMPEMRALGVLLFVAGGAASLAAVWYLGRALTPVPEPNGEGLSARGIYAWVRHPMYSSVVVAGLGVALVKGSLASLLLVVVLALFFEVKTRREERFLVAAYSGYPSYAARTGKFVPWLGKHASPPIVHGEVDFGQNNVEAESRD